MTRAEKVTAAQALRADGLLLREIAAQMGVAIQTVDGWLSDPDSSKQRARRARYAIPCVDCGKPTDGSGGYADPRARCASCARIHQHETRHWTRERIIEWIKAYETEQGCPPPASVQVRRRQFPDAPGTEATAREFGTDGWRKALRAAGFEPYRDFPGLGHKLGVDHPLMRETRDLYEAGWTTPEIAERHGVTPTAICLRLDRLGVPRRTSSEAARLRWARKRELQVAA